MSPARYSLVCLALVVASPATADTEIETPWTEVVEKYEDGGNCAFYRYYLQFNEVDGASTPQWRIACTECTLEPE